MQEQTTDLIKSLSIENLVRQRSAIFEKLQRAMELIKEAEEISAKCAVGFPRFVIDEEWALRGRNRNVISGLWRKSQDEIERYIAIVIDKPAWEHLLDESGMKSFMNAEARAAFSKQIREGEAPPFEMDNIMSTFGSIYSRRKEMFDDGVIKCFRRLSWDYKTNCPVKFGKRIIINHFISESGYPQYGSADELDDLMRVFSVFDGKPEPDHRTGIYHHATECWKKGGNSIENDYLRIKWFKKKTAHIDFLRPDLVVKLNEIVAKRFPNALPASS